jgi:glutaminyl-tRNA synthetase
MAVLDPLKLTITNWPVGHVEFNQAINNPEDPDAGLRQVPMSGTLWIEQEDFQETAPRKFFRLKKGGAVRLRAGYIIDCHDVIKDGDGNIIEVLCTYDPETKSGSGQSDRKVKGTIHWVSAEHAVEFDVRLYDRLFTVDDPGSPAPGKEFIDYLNPDSLRVIAGYGEPALAESEVDDRIQFERLGYFVVDRDSTAERSVFNRIVPLRDTWAKVQANT